MALCDRVVLLVFWILLRTFSGADVAACVFSGSCVLPCSFHPGGEEVIHWIQVQTEDLNVHSFYEDRDQLTLQDRRFRGRTALFKDQISGKGNASLLLTEVRIQDQGRYKCYASTRTGSTESFFTLNVNAPVREVHIQRVGDRISCSSEGVYPQPELSWTTSPRSNGTLQNQTSVQQTQQQLYSISSSVAAPAPAAGLAAGLDYSCTVRAGMSQRKATWFPPASVNGSEAETSITCRSSSSPPTGLIWRFNHSQIILNRTGTEVTVSEAWRPHVRPGSESGRLTLEDLSPDQEGLYSCELSDAEETFVSSFLLGLQESPDGHSVAAAAAGWAAGAIFFLGLIIAAIVIYIKCKNRRRNIIPQRAEEEMIPMNEQR